jgi:SnoaL-like protein
VEGSVGTRFVAALAAQDEQALARCFAPDVRLRALIPRGLRERAGAADAAALVAGWFSDATRLDLVEGGDPYVVEQHLYCTLGDGLIARADLLCPGFRARPRPS